MVLLCCCRHLPLAKDLQQTARQQLVSRLEGYCRHQKPLFGRVLALVDEHVVPVLQQGALSGTAEWVSVEELFSKHPGCVDMLLDVLSDRGFQAHYIREVMSVPMRFDAATGAIQAALQPVHRFKFSFDAAGVRDASALKALEIAARITEAARNTAAAAATSAADGSGSGALNGSSAARLAPAAAPITESFIPEHLDLEAKMRAQDKSQQLKRVALAKQHGCDSTACDSSSGSACAGAAAGDDMFTIHRCLRPDIKCGHAQELEVVSASG